MVFSIEKHIVILFLKKFNINNYLCVIILFCSTFFQAVAEIVSGDLYAFDKRTQE